MAEYLTRDRERDYQRKLADLWKRYDALREEVSRLKLLADKPPQTICEMLGRMLFHICTAKGCYKGRLEVAPDDLNLKRQLANAVECEAVLRWLEAMRTADKGAKEAAR